MACRAPSRLRAWHNLWMQRPARGRLARLCCGRPWPGPLQTMSPSRSAVSKPFGNQLGLALASRLPVNLISGAMSRGLSLAAGLMTHRARFLCGLCLSFAVAATSAWGATGDIPWNRSLTITRTSSDDDIKNVFRSILQANGLSVAFGPAVHDTVSFHMEQVPIQQAFEQLIDQHHLT